MHFKKGELTLMYNSKNPRDTKVLTTARVITEKINKQDLCEVDVSATLFEYFVENLGGDPKLLMNKSLPYYQENLKGGQYSVKMWFEALRKMPDLLLAPLATYNGKVIICNTPNDILKLNQRA